MNMRLLLTPDNKQHTLRAAYQYAFRDATELYIAAAYLTDWDKGLRLSPTCKRLVFLVGTDFGLSRKHAMRQVLRWLPRDASAEFRAIPDGTGHGFHPKLVAWRNKRGEHYAIIGSSNLSSAGFSTNYEANITTRISKQEYGVIRTWLDPLIPNALPITPDWISNHYREAKNHHRGTTPHHPLHINLKLPDTQACRQEVKQRRKQQIAFRQIQYKLRRAIQSCASGQLTKQAFWKQFWELWAHHDSRFQGSGLQFRCKGANWQEACSALNTILSSRQRNDTELDQTVATQIDELAAAKNPARGAWLSEMLCHYYPDHYPITNNPVRKWLAYNKWRGRPGTTEGQRYTLLAQQLRTAVNAKPAGARNLAELDAAIWRWVHDHKL